MAWFRCAAAVAMIVLAAPVNAGMELAMIEQPGCIYCARWNEDVGPIYPKTAEGEVAPLRRLQLNDPLPDDVTLERPAILTPTFVLLVDGTESARMEGYVSADFFWAFLAQMIADADSN